MVGTTNSDARGSQPEQRAGKRRLSGGTSTFTTDSESIVAFLYSPQRSLGKNTWFAGDPCALLAAVHFDFLFFLNQQKHFLSSLVLSFG